MSQVAMTFGGSLIPGALGAMLIEILPFLRGIGSDIQDALGDESPALVPTTMVAYALTSFLIGFVFVALGVFKAGILVRDHILMLLQGPKSNSLFITLTIGFLLSNDGPYWNHRWYWRLAFYPWIRPSLATFSPRTYSFFCWQRYFQP